VIGPIYGLHPDWAKIDWAKTTWLLDGKQVTPDPKKSLAGNGIGHKSVLRFTTPGLCGPGGCCA
jgi:phenol hydroxylase P4 protein